MEEEEKRLVVDATMDNLDRVVGFVEEQLVLQGCPKKIQGQICVSLEEIYVNIVNYAYDGYDGECTINVDITTFSHGKEMALTIKDKGTPFNPLEKEDPDITLSAEDRQIGGLGIYMVKQSMDAVSYAYRENCNILTIHKKWEM